MTQTTLTFNKPQPHELFKKGSQDFRIYERLLVAPLTNAEIIDELRVFSYTRRISDLREKLKPYLMDVKATRIREGLFEYKLT
jgi:hypothetical protein